jgi:hypothetical protein
MALALDEAFVAAAVTGVAALEAMWAGLSIPGGSVSVGIAEFFTVLEGGSGFDMDQFVADPLTGPQVGFDATFNISPATGGEASIFGFTDPNPLFDLTVFADPNGVTVEGATAGAPAPDDLPPIPPGPPPPKPGADPIPEPGSLSLVIAGLAFAGVIGWRQRRRAA